MRETNVSITMEAAFCVETVKHGKPEIFNTDQGSQFTGAAFTGLLIKNGIAISMDGKRRVGETTSSSSVCGAASNTKRCISGPTIAPDRSAASVRRRGLPESGHSCAGPLEDQHLQASSANLSPALFLCKSGFTTSRAQSRKSCATGLIARFFNVINPTGQGLTAKSTGKILNGGRSEPNFSTESGIVTKKGPFLRRDNNK